MEPLTLVTVLWLYLPGYLANTAAMFGGRWIPQLTGLPAKPIDGRRVLADGNRLLGDGKTWNGLIGGVIGGGLLALGTQALSTGTAPWMDLTGGADALTAFKVGCALGFGCMLGDSLGSFIKRRQGMKREGETSSEAPLLDTLPFAICAFITGQLLFPALPLGDRALLPWMAVLLVLTPLIHRGVNIFGYKVGLKDVPY